MKQKQTVARLTSCRICQSQELHEILPFGDIPLPNGFLHREEIKKKEFYFPLTLGFCTQCGLTQLLEIVDPSIMFRNYVYIPSASKTRMQNFEQITEQATTQYNLEDNDLVIDIGSNDGSLLSYFKGRGFKTLGIDPATNLSKIAQLKGIETVNDFISPNVAKKIRRNKGSAKVITATNVVAHVSDLHKLFQSIEILLHDDGVFICEFPYLVDLIEKNQFDTIYHEHLSYFSIKPLLYLIEKSKLKLVNIVRTSIDGGSLRLFFMKKKSSQKPQKAVDQFLALEEKSGIYSKKTFSEFASRVKHLKRDLKKSLVELKSKGKTIAGYGAAAKGNILLNYCNLNSKIIDFIVDSTPYKQGLYTPGTHIPILPESEIFSRKPDYTIILAWNFAQEIMDKEQRYKKAGGKFIIPVPQVTII